MAAPKINNPLFDKRLVNAFVEGVLTTLANMAQTTATPHKGRIESAFSPKGEIAGMVGIVAPPLKGSLLIVFTQESICHIIENMLGECHTTINSEVSDAVGELTNMIYGSAKTTLNQLGYKFEMAIPTVIAGDFKIMPNSGAATLLIPFELPNNSVFYIQITVQP